MTPDRPDAPACDRELVLQLVDALEPAAMGELYERYAERAADPRTERTVRNWLGDAASAGLVARVGDKRGRRYRTCIDVDAWTYAPPPISKWVRDELVADAEPAPAIRADGGQSMGMGMAAGQQPVAELDQATLLTTGSNAIANRLEGRIEIYPGWVRVVDGRTAWIPREQVEQIGPR